MVVGKNYPWILKLVGKIMVRNGSRILTMHVFSVFRSRSQYLPIRYVLFTNGRKITGEQPGRRHLQQVIRLNRPRQAALRGAQCHFCGVLAQNILSQSNHEDTSEKPEVRGHL